MPPHEHRLLDRLRFRHLQLIAAIERTGSLRGSAAALNLTQPALSKALKELEMMLGFRLFVRGARGLTTTPQGAIVIQGASLLIRELQHMHAEANAVGPDGRVAAILRIGAPAYLSVSLIPRVIARLRAASPPLIISLYENYVPNLIQSLLSGDLDALVSVYNPTAMASTDGQGIRFEKIAEEQYLVVAPNTYRRRKASWQTLAGEPWILTRKPSLARMFIDDSFRSNRLDPPSVICETDSPVTSARLVAEGIGISSVPASTAREAEFSGRIRLIRLESPPPVAMVGLIYRLAASCHPRISLLRSAIQHVYRTC